MQNQLLKQQQLQNRYTLPQLLTLLVPDRIMPCKDILEGWPVAVVAAEVPVEVVHGGFDISSIMGISEEFNMPSLQDPIVPKAPQNPLAPYFSAMAITAAMNNKRRQLEDQILKCRCRIMEGRPVTSYQG